MTSIVNSMSAEAGSATDIEMREGISAATFRKSSDCIALLTCERESEGLYTLRDSYFKDLEALREYETMCAESAVGSRGDDKQVLLFLQDNDVYIEYLEYLATKRIPKELVDTFTEFNIPRDDKQSGDYRSGTGNDGYRVFRRRWWRKCRVESKVYSRRETYEISMHCGDFSMPLPWMGDRIAGGKEYPLPRIAVRNSVSAVQTPTLLIMRLSFLGFWFDDEARSTATTWPLLISDLKTCRGIHPSNFFSCAIHSLHGVILYDESLVLHELKLGLGFIDRGMALDSRIRNGIADWRYVMGYWRSYLHSRGELERQVHRMLDVQEEGTVGGEDVHEPSEQWMAQDLLPHIADMEADTRSTLAHCESTFNALMATMSIIESGKAIAEAEEVTKLTQLAFFFIPLTFIAGIFGMNLAEFGERAPKLKIWGATSACVLGVTYFALYMKKLWNLARRGYHWYNTHIDRRSRIIDGIMRALRWPKTNSYSDRHSSSNRAELQKVYRRVKRRFLFEHV